MSRTDKDAEKESDEGHDLDEELIELLNELRVALPGVQVLFAFLLVVPFNQGWAKVDGFEQTAYFASFLATTLASILLKAPTAHHRLRWRSRDKEALLQIANRLVIAGTLALAFAITTAVAFVTHYLFEGGAASLVTGLTALGFVLLWYVIPLWRRIRTGS